MNSAQELPGALGIVDRAQKFEELLERLRSMYEDVCAQRHHVELELSELHKDRCQEVKQDDLFVPTEVSVARGPTLSLKGVAQSSSFRFQDFLVTPPRTPRNPAALLVLGPDPIEKMGEQQNTSSMEQGPSASPVKNFPSAGALEESPFQDAISALEESALRDANSVRSRFAVSSGRTVDSSFWVWHSVSEATSLASLRRHLKPMLNSSCFSILMLVVLALYALFIAFETEVISQDPQMESLTIKIVHYIFNAIFLVELLLRVIADGYSAFSKGLEGFWNRLDALLVISAIVEVVLENLVAGSGSATQSTEAVRLVRIARVVRTVRLLRSFRQFHEFQKMAYALMSSVRTLVCSLAILVFVMFVFAVGLTRSAADLDMREQIQDLDLRYGNLRSTTYTLFLSVSNGISWDYAYTPLHELSWWSASSFIIYISIMLFGVFNVLTSIFVESVTRSVQHYKDLIVRDKEVEKQIAILHVKEVFHHVDSDGSGQVSIDELEHFLSEPSLRKYMEALDIDAEDTRLLFRLLDRDDSGIISLEEFCEGCLRLKGNARSMDVQTLLFQLRNFLKKWSEFTSFVEDSFSHLHQAQSQDCTDGGRAAKS